MPRSDDATSQASQSDFAISGDTATPRGIIMLEPISEVNVRTSPEITEDNQVGTIRAGERYMVLGRYFNWVQFQYDLAPNGRAWVYRDLIEIIGNESVIPTLVPNASPTVDPLVAGATQTREAILAQPGGELTVTAQSRIIQLPNGAIESNGANSGGVLQEETPRATFTYPPGVAVGVPTLVATREVNTNTSTQDASAPVAPIIPIAALGLFGMLGISLSLLRR